LKTSADYVLLTAVGERILAVGSGLGERLGILRYR
jgi:hypothetical protein